MKTIIALSAALLLSFAAPAYASHGPTPVGKKDHQEMMTKKKKNKKHNKKKNRKLRLRGEKTCEGLVGK